jgi:glycosyltransferase involved in cell wall biosynthesis
VAKISIVTSGHICTNPRVWREADALSAAGHDVTVIGVSFDPQQAELDQQMLKKRAWTYQAAADLRHRSLSSSITRSWYRFRSRVARCLLTANLQDPHALGYAVDRLLTSSIKRNANLTITHLEVAMWVGRELQKRGLRVGVDIEDWYSESTPNPSLPRARFLRGLEEEILKRSVHMTTTSTAMAGALQAAYGCAKPKVIYNSLPSVRVVGCGFRDGPSRLIWFSQTLGKDRGLQDVFAALPLLRGDWTLELRSHVSSEMWDWVESQVPSSLRWRVKIEPTVPPDELPSVVAKHDIGLAPEQPSCRNKALTVSNKMFQYLQSGLLVAASDTPGQREVLDAFPQGGRLYPPGNPDSLARVLNSWLLDPLQIRIRKDLVSREANELFGYERQTRRLLESVSLALEN